MTNPTPPAEPRARISGVDIVRNARSEAHASLYTDCPKCGETSSVPPPVTRPAITLNPGADDEAVLSAPSAASVCIACDAVVHFHHLTSPSQPRPPRERAGSRPGGARSKPDTTENPMTYQPEFELVVELGETENRLGAADDLDAAMDLVDPDRELPWIQGGPAYIAARAGVARFVARRPRGRPPAPTRLRPCDCPNPLCRRARRFTTGRGAQPRHHPHPHEEVTAMPGTHAADTCSEELADLILEVELDRLAALRAAITSGVQLEDPARPGHRYWYDPADTRYPWTDGYHRYRTAELPCVLAELPDTIGTDDLDGD